MSDMISAAQRVSANLRRFRRLQDLSQEAAAEAAGLSRVTWTNWEKDSSNASLEGLERAARALGVSLGDLVGEDAPALSPVAREIVAIVTSPALNEAELRRVLSRARILAGFDAPEADAALELEQKKKPV